MKKTGNKYIVFFLMIINSSNASGITNHLKLKSCPDISVPGTWNNLNNEHCSQQQGKTLHCQSDNGNNIIYSMCAESKHCDRGTHAHLDTTTRVVTCKPCDKGFYQSAGKFSYQYSQPNCDQTTVRCQDRTGLELCKAATATHDYKCRCNYTMGYVPTMNTQKCRSECYSYNDECDCAEHKCDIGEELNNEYMCVPVPTTKSSTKPAMMAVQIISTTTSRLGANTGHDEGSSQGVVAGIIVLILLIVIIAVLALIYWKYHEKIDKKIPCLKKCCTCCKASKPPSTPDERKHLSSQEPNKQLANGSSEPMNRDTNLNHPRPSTEVSSHDAGVLVVGNGKSYLLTETAELAVSKQKIKDNVTAAIAERSARPSPQTGQSIINAQNVNIGDNPQMTIVYTDKKSPPIPSNDNLGTV